MYRRIIVARRELLTILKKHHRDTLRAIRKGSLYRALILRDMFCDDLIELTMLEAFEDYYEE